MVLIVLSVFGKHDIDMNTANFQVSYYDEMMELMTVHTLINKDS